MVGPTWTAPAKFPPAFVHSEQSPVNEMSLGAKLLLNVPVDVAARQRMSFICSPVFVHSEHLLVNKIDRFFVHPSLFTVNISR